ncbi:MAG: hypothetical protein JJU33_01875 [Phycisphaerales bacterium]|nr:hypothetical protein [Phycisphaerales bacterium]
MDESRDIAGSRVGGLPPGVSPAAVQPPKMLKATYTDYWITGGEVGRWPVWYVGAFFAIQTIAIVSIVWIHIGAQGWGYLRPHPDRFWFTMVILLLFVIGSESIGVRRARPVYRRTGDLRQARHVFGITKVICAMVAGACWFWVGMMLGHSVLPLGVAAGLVVVGAVSIVTSFAVAPRVGTTLRCARCGYPFDNAGDYLCSECGKAWLAPSGLVRGEKIRPKPFHYGVLGACVLPIVATALLMLFAGVHRLTPTDRLVEQAIRQSNEFVFLRAFGAWNELEQRRLSPAQVSRLAEGLIGDGDEPPNLTPEARSWLLDRLLAGELPEPTVDRILQRMMSPLLAVPREVRVGEAFTVRADVQVIWGRVHVIDAAIAVRGSAAGDEDGAEILADRFVPVQAHLRGAPGPIGTFTFTAESAGDLEVTVDFWIFAVPGPETRGIVWRPDGTPEPPPGAYGAVRRSLSGTVRVLPAEAP